MSPRRKLAAWLALACLATAPAAAQKKNPDGAPVLLLTGGQREHHGYRDQAFYLARALEDTGRSRVTIAEDAAILETPAMARYALIIVNADRRDPEFRLTEGQQRALLDFVRSGRGYVSIHGADNAAPDWLPEMKQMLGGIFSHRGAPDGKTRKGTYTIHIAPDAGPVASGLHDFEIRDELYYQMQMEPDVTPLATAAYDGHDWPVAWTRPYGRGRVFHTVLGHRDFGPEKDDPLRNPDLLALVIRGVEWAAGAAAKQR